MQQSYLMQQRGVSRVAETEVKGLLHEMIDHLVVDFGVAHVKRAGKVR
jgi:hypothetical protein